MTDIDEAVLAAHGDPERGLDPASPEPEPGDELEPQPEPEPGETPTLDPAGAGARIATMVEEEAERAEAEEEAPSPPEHGVDIPPPDPYTETCPDCKGFGNTETGSRVESQLFRECVTCSGRGWVDRGTFRAPQPTFDPPEEDGEGEGSWRWQPS